MNITSFLARIQPRHGRNTNVGTYTSVRRYRGERGDRSNIGLMRPLPAPQKKRQPHELGSVIA